jgi:hypothetical protein
MADTIVRRAGEQGITPFWNRIPRFFLSRKRHQPSTCSTTKLTSSSAIMLPAR